MEQQREVRVRKVPCPALGFDKQEGPFEPWRVYVDGVLIATRRLKRDAVEHAKYTATRANITRLVVETGSRATAAFQHDDAIVIAKGNLALAVAKHRFATNDVQLHAASALVDRRVAELQDAIVSAIQRAEAYV